MRAELVCDAIWPSAPAPGARRTQYASTELTALLADHEMAQSMSRPRQCWHNAVAEAWFGNSKRELIYGRHLGHSHPAARGRV